LYEDGQGDIFRAIMTPVRRHVCVCLSLSFRWRNYFGEFLFNGISRGRHQRAILEDEDDAGDIVAVDWVWRATMVERASAGAAHQACHDARYCLQDAGHQTPPNAAPNCRFLLLLLLLRCCCCSRPGGRVMSANSSERRTRLPFTADTDRLSCYCTRSQLIHVDRYRNV